MKKLILFSFVLFTAILSCRKDLDYSETTTLPSEPARYVKASIGGLVVDETGAGVPDATVYLGTSEIKTDKNGVFNFKNVVVNANGAYVKVEHPAYFHGSRTVIVGPATRNTVKIQLLANTATRFVDAATGGIADYNDYSVTLPAGGIVTAGGAAYSGQVGVAAKWLNPVSSGFVEQMPGRLRGVTTDNELSGMVSLGMLAVELKDNAGNKLQIRDGQQATLRMKVPAQLLASAPASIPLWYFNEMEGLWVEEGQATLNNGFYEGQVKHFSFWNHDYKDPLVEIKFKVIDQNGNLIEGAKVYTQLVNSGLYGFGYTDNTGVVYGLVPKNEILNAEVYPPNPNCSSPVLKQQIGPFAQNDSFCFTINLSGLSTYSISGDLVDCNGAPVTNGYVLVDGQSDIFWTDNSGHFEISIISCTPISTITFTGYDLAALKASIPMTVDVSSGSANAGTVTACSSIPYYLTYTYNGQTSTNINPKLFSLDSFPSTPIDFVNITSSDTTDLYINMYLENVNGVGTYTANYFNAEGQLNGNPIYHSCQGMAFPCTGMTINITEFNGVGGVMAGNYSGTLWDRGSGQQPTPPVTVSGSFRGILK